MLQRHPHAFGQSPRRAALLILTTPAGDAAEAEAGLFTRRARVSGHTRSVQLSSSHNWQKADPESAAPLKTHPACQRQLHPQRLTLGTRSFYLFPGMRAPRGAGCSGSPPRLLTKEPSCLCVNVLPVEEQSMGRLGHSAS